MEDRLRVVFISRRNSLRSVLAEACLAHLDARNLAVSSGQPASVAEAFHPAAVGALGSASIALPAAPPKSWDALVMNGAPAAHVIITLDEHVAIQVPRWRGQLELATWPFPDVSAAESNDAETAIAAIRMLYAVRRRLELLVSLPLGGSDRSAVRSDVRDLAHLR